MTEKDNPLYHEVSGKGEWNGLIEFDGMNKFIGDYHSYHMFDQKIAKLRGAVLRYYGQERETCDMKVYHPTEKDSDGDSCALAVYDFYNLKLNSLHWGVLRFTGLLTGIRRYEGELPEVTDRDEFPYQPPQLKVGLLPVPVKLSLWTPRSEEDDD